MSFVNPTYLWALLGLLIPVAIHLWSNKEGKTIKIGSTKLLNEVDSKQSSNISLNELLLLAFRLLIIALVVLIMAEPQFKKTTKNKTLTYIVEPSLLKNSKIINLVDSLKAIFPVLLLHTNFPEIDKLPLENTDTLRTPNYWQLAKDMEALKTDSIIILTNSFLKGLKGKRPTINRPLNWVILDIESSEETYIKTVLKSDSIQLLSLISKPDNLSFNKETLSFNSPKIKLNKTKDSITINRNNKITKQPFYTEKALKIFLYHENKFKNNAIYLETALNSISSYLNVPININKTQDSLSLNFSDYDRIIWLSERHDFKIEQKFLFYKIDKLANNIIAKGETNNTAYLTQSLDPETILNKQFAKQLISWLDLHPDLEKNIELYDNRLVSKTELLPVYKTNTKTSNLYIKTWPIAKWLGLLLALLLIAERLIAYLKKQ